MITEKKFLICTCDSCGRLLFEDYNCVFEDKDAVDAAILENGWVSMSGCQLCYSNKRECPRF